MRFWIHSNSQKKVWRSKKKCDACFYEVIFAKLTKTVPLSIIYTLLSMKTRHVCIQSVNCRYGAYAVNQQKYEATVCEYINHRLLNTKHYLFQYKTFGRKCCACSKTAAVKTHCKTMVCWMLNPTESNTFGPILISAV